MYAVFRFRCGRLSPVTLTSQSARKRCANFIGCYRIVLAHSLQTSAMSKSSAQLDLEIPRISRLEGVVLALADM